MYGYEVLWDWGLDSGNLACSSGCWGMGTCRRVNDDSVVSLFD
jgi:hypothetical protein